MPIPFGALLISGDLRESETNFEWKPFQSHRNLESCGLQKAGTVQCSLSRAGGEGGKSPFRRWHLGRSLQVASCCMLGCKHGDYFGRKGERHRQQQHLGSLLSSFQRKTSEAQVSYSIQPAEERTKASERIDCEQLGVIKSIASPPNQPTFIFTSINSPFVHSSTSILKPISLEEHYTRWCSAFMDPTTTSMLTALMRTAVARAVDARTS